MISDGCWMRSTFGILTVEGVDSDEESLLLEED